MGTITPEPIIIYEPKPQFCPVYKPWKQSIKNMVKKKKEKKIKLSIYNHNGGYTVDDLLDGNEDTFYESKWGITNGDWIIFKIHSPALITKIKVRNVHDDDAIHSIALFIGSEQSPNKMHRLCKNIENIQKTKRLIQEFDIFDSLLLSEHYLWRNTEKFNLLKLEILENYGAIWNVFCEFEVYGYFEKDVQKNINLLMEQLIVRKTEILDKRIFWQQLGFIIKNTQKYNEEIVIIVNHPLLLQPSEYIVEDWPKVVLERIVEELHLKIVPVLFATAKMDPSSSLSDFIVQYLQRKKDVDPKGNFLIKRVRSAIYFLNAEIKCEYLMLVARNSRTELSWNTLGFEISADDITLLSLINKHKALFEKSKYKEIMIVDRLTKELGLLLSLAKDHNEDMQPNVQ